jgi:hypothetical protein
MGSGSHSKIQEAPEETNPIALSIDYLLDRRGCLRSDALDLQQVLRRGVKAGPESSKSFQKPLCTVRTNSWQTLQATKLPSLFPLCFGLPVRPIVRVAQAHHLGSRHTVSAAQIRPKRRDRSTGTSKISMRVISARCNASRDTPSLAHSALVPSTM